MKEKAQVKKNDKHQLNCFVLYADFTLTLNLKVKELMLVYLAKSGFAHSSNNQYYFVKLIGELFLFILHRFILSIWLWNF